MSKSNLSDKKWKNNLTGIQIFIFSLLIFSRIVRPLISPTDAFSVFNIFVIVLFLYVVCVFSHHHLLVNHFQSPPKIQLMRPLLCSRACSPFRPYYFWPHFPSSTLPTLSPASSLSDQRTHWGAYNKFMCIWILSSVDPNNMPKIREARNMKSAK
jgi:hypothetical protein